MTSWADVRARKRPARTTIAIGLDPDAVEEMATATAAARRARTAADAQQDSADVEARAVAAEAHLDDVRTSLVEAGRVAQFTLEAIPRPVWDELLAQHPHPDGPDAGDYNRDTWPPAVIAAGVVDPDLSLDDATELWAEWSDGECGLLLNQITQLTRRTNVVDLGKGSTPTAT